MLDHLEPFVPCGRNTEFNPNCERQGCWALHHKPSFYHLLEMAKARIGRAVGVTDIDGMIEINGRILVVEHKGAGCDMKPGQKAALLELSAASDRITVLVHRPHWQPDATDNMVMRNGVASPWQRWTHGEFWEYYTGWLAAAKASTPQRGRAVLA